MDFFPKLSEKEEEMDSEVDEKKEKEAKKKREEEEVIFKEKHDLEIISTISEDFFDPDFSIDQFIQSLPGSLEDDYLEEQIQLRKQQSDAVASRLSTRILGSYDAFVQGMVEVGQLNQDIERTAKLCDIGRSHLLTAKQSLTHTGFRIISQHRKRLLYRHIIGYLQQIHEAQNAKHLVIAASEEGNFPQAIKLCQDCIKTLNGLKEFAVAKSIQKEITDEYLKVQQRMEVVLGDLCRNFDETKYGLVLRGFRALGRHFNVVEKIQTFFLNAIQTQTHNVVYAHILQSEELTKGSKPSALKKKLLKDLCVLLPTLSDTVFVSCLSHVLACMTDLMRSHWVISNWHARHDLEERKAAEGVAASGEGTKNFADVLTELSRFKKMMWDHMQRNCNKILTTASLPKYKIDSFLRILDATDRFTKIGEAFSNSPAPGMYKTMKFQSKIYFQNYHKARLEDLRTMLENEMWIAMPVQANFTLYEIKEFSTFLELSSTTADANALSESVNADAFFQRYENPFSIEAQRKEEKQKEEEEEDGDIPEELKQEFIDEEGDGSAHPRRRASVQDGTKRKAAESEGESPLVTTTSINVLRYMGKYLHMIKILQPISYHVFFGFRQIFEYYMYTVYSFFATPGRNINAEIEDQFFGLDPVVYKRIKRIRDSLIHEGAATEATDMRPHAAPLSPMVAGDLHRPEAIYGISSRCVGIGSLMFIAKSLQLCRTHLENILPPSSHQQQQKSVQEFYESSVDACDEIRNYLVYCAARDALDPGDIATQVGSVRWDVSGKDLGAGGENPYVQVLKYKFTNFSKCMEEAKSTWNVPDHIIFNMWNSAIKIAMYQLVEGFSRAKRCTNEGRALMALDLQTFREELKRVCPLSPIPYMSHVEAYIKAYYLPQGELLPWVKEQTEYTPKQLLHVTVLAVGKLSPKVRLELLKAVKNYLNRQ